MWLAPVGSRAAIPTQISAMCGSCIAGKANKRGFNIKPPCPKLATCVLSDFPYSRRKPVICSLVNPYFFHYISWLFGTAKVTHLITSCEKIRWDRWTWPHNASNIFVRERDLIERSSMESFVAFDSEEAIFFLHVTIFARDIQVRTEALSWTTFWV